MKKVVLPGFLVEIPHAGPGKALGIKVPCETCQAWHLHGAGTTLEPSAKVGVLVDRVAHCRVRSGQRYTDIDIQPEPFRRSWQRDGRITRAYREWCGRVTR